MSAEPAPLQKTDKPPPRYGGRLVRQRPAPLLGELPAGLRLVEAVVADRDADGVLRHTPLHAFAPQHLSHVRRGLATAETRCGFGQRHLFVGEDTGGSQAIERVGDERAIWLMATEAQLKFPSRFPPARQRVDGPIHDIGDRRLAGEMRHGRRIQGDASAGGTGVAERGDGDGECTAVGQRQHEATRPTGGLEHLLDGARAMLRFGFGLGYEKSRGATHNEPW